MKQKPKFNENTGQCWAYVNKYLFSCIFLEMNSINIMTLLGDIFQPKLPNTMSHEICTQFNCSYLVIRSDGRQARLFTRTLPG